MESIGEGILVAKPLLAGDKEDLRVLCRLQLRKNNNNTNINNLGGDF